MKRVFPPPGAEQTAIREVPSAAALMNALYASVLPITLGKVGLEM